MVSRREEDTWDDGAFLFSWTFERRGDRSQIGGTTSHSMCPLPAQSVLSEAKKYVQYGSKIIRGWGLGGEKKKRRGTLECCLSSRGEREGGPPWH